MFTFDGPDGVQGWEREEKKCFWTTFGPQSVERGDFFQKLGLALGLGSGLAFQGVKMSTFDEPHGVQGWGSDEKSVLEQSLAPKCGKVDFFQKLGLALG